MRLHEEDELISRIHTDCVFFVSIPIVCCRCISLRVNRIRYNNSCTFSRMSPATTREWVNQPLILLEPEDGYL